MRRYILLVLTLACVVQPLTAQFPGGERAGLTSLSVPRDTPSGTLLLRTGSESHPSYWFEGGMVTGVGLLLVAMPFLLDSDRALPLKLVGASFLVGVGFAPGALIGGIIPKSRDATDTSGAQAGDPR